MRTLAWCLVGLTLLSGVLITHADHSEEDLEGDGELGANQNAEQIAIAKGIAEDRREQESKPCVLLDPTKTSPDKAMLDRKVNKKCNDAKNDINNDNKGDCNCPENGICTVQGTEIQDYFCSVVSPSARDQYGNGLILGELEDPQVYFIEGVDKK